MFKKQILEKLNRVSTIKYEPILLNNKVMSSPGNPSIYNKSLKTWKQEYKLVSKIMFDQSFLIHTITSTGIWMCNGDRNTFVDQLISIFVL